MAIRGNGVQAMSPFEQELSAVLPIPRKGIAGDGTEPTKTGPAMPTTGDEPVAPTGPKTLETADDTTTFRTIDMLVRSQDRLAINRWAIDTYHTWVDAGIPFGVLDKEPNQNLWIAKLPPGMTSERGAAIPNKANDLNNKVSEQLLADPPRPNPDSKTNGEKQDEASELAAQFLKLSGGEFGSHDVDNLRWALRTALVRCSGFLHVDIDVDGGGYQPYQVLAHPKAQDPNNPLVAMLPDPNTGQPIPETTASPVLRYVSAQGQFVQSPAEADRVWLPDFDIQRLRREQIRTFPPTATVDDAKAVIILGWCTLAEAREYWDSVATMDMTQLTNLASWRPPLSERIVPFTFRGGIADGQTGPSLPDVGNLSPLLQRRMFFYRLYVNPDQQEYPNGLVIDVTGQKGGLILNRETLDYQIPTSNGQMDTRCREIPIVQLTPVQDTEGNDPFGWPFINRFAGSTEATATLYSSYLDALERMINPHVFIPSTTPIDDVDWADRSKPVLINPGDQMPVFEQIPPLPDIVGVTQDMRQQQDTASGLTATAQGLDSENAVSGTAKNLTIKQAQVALSGILQQVRNAFTKLWRIKVQYAQAKFSTPQLLQYSGDEGSSEPKWFRGEDLAGVDTIGIEIGTGTMQTPTDKANSLAFIQSQGWLTPDQVADVALAALARDIGLPPDPITQAIDRAVSLWLDGPSPIWMQQMQAYQQSVQQAQTTYQQQAALAQRMGGMAPVPPQAPPPPQPPVNPFQPKPNDTEPTVAMKWMKRLSRLMLDPAYDAQPPEWQDLVNQKYMVAVQALQPPAQLPKGVVITAKADPSSIAADEQAAIQGLKPNPNGSQPPTVPGSPAQPQPPRQPMAA